MSRIHEAMMRLGEVHPAAVPAHTPALPDSDPVSPRAPGPSVFGGAVRPPAAPTRPAALDESGSYQLAGPLATGAVTHPDADPALVDEFRKLAATLHHAQLGQDLRAVTITSSTPQEGKTLTAINLALTLCVSYRRRVLLIDADLRAPSVHTWLGLPAAPGLTDVIAGRTGAEWPLNELGDGLSVLTAGTRTRDPISRLSSEQMRRIVMEARTRFDWVIMDLSPVAALPDAPLVTALSDATLIVVRAGSVSSRLVQHAIDAIGEEKIVGLVLNGASAAAFDEAYGGYVYGYEATKPLK
jgi:protein-tyrosine kinase